MTRRINSLGVKTSLTALLLTMGASLNAGSYASVKAMGVGGAAVAHGQDAITGYFNPATAVTVGDRVDLGFYAQIPDRDLRITGQVALPNVHVQTVNDADFYGDGGLNLVLGCCDEFALGIQWNNYNHIHNHFDGPLSNFGTTNAKFNYRTEVLTGTLAYQIDSRNSIGVSLNTYFSWLDVKGLNSLFTQTAVPASLTNNTTDHAVGLGVTIGWLGRFLCDDLAVGFAYSPTVEMGNFHKYEGLFARDAIDIPETFRFGAAYDIDCFTVVLADAEWRRYSRVAALSNIFPADRKSVV